MRTALTIAGSDSGGGAGIQADLKTMQANGVYGMSAITALTAQNTTGVQGIFEVTPAFLEQEIDSVFTDIRPDAVKIGMVSSAALIRSIAKKLKEYQADHIVVDPVMVATSGSKLLQDDAVETLVKELLPLAEVITPNIPEGEILSGMAIRSEADMIEAAKKISAESGCAVLLKGGHSLNDANDLLYRNGTYKWFRGKRIDNPNTHGTGCTLSSAIASNLAKGRSLDEAVELSKEYISGALAAQLNLGAGSGPMDHGFDLTGKFAEHNAAGTYFTGYAMTDRMLIASEQIWEGYHVHPFVRGIADGSLDPKKFEFYMLQDYVYLFDYARVFALGVAKAASEEAMAYNAQMVQQILNGEMEIHRGYMKRLGISEKAAAATKPSLDNLSYTSYMIRVSYEGGAPEAAAAILSCALSYEVIARRIVRDHPEAEEHPFYGEWVKGYASEAYHEGNVVLMKLMESLAADLNDSRKQHLEEIFVNCSRYEALFWDMAWEMRQ